MERGGRHPVCAEPVGTLDAPIRYGGAAVAASTDMAKQIGHYWPFFLPDGHRFLFTALGSPDTVGIYLGDLSGGTPTRLTNTFSPAEYLPNGWMLWVRDGALVTQRLDVAKSALTGAPVTLANGISVAYVSATGLIAYRAGAAASQMQLTWFDRSGAARGNVDRPGGVSEIPRVAPDGRRVVVSLNSGGPFEYLVAGWLPHQPPDVRYD